MPVPAPASSPATPAQRAALDTAQGYARQSLSPATLKAYRADWEDFCGWCSRGGWQALPAAPQTVAAYLADHASTHSRATLKRRLGAIGQYHRMAGQEWLPSHPVIRHTLRGILRRHGAPCRRAAALTTPEIRKLLATCGGGGLTNLRDRTLILLGYAGALRRSEMVAIQREHITFTGEGLRLLIPRSKTDAEGQGVEIGIPRGDKPATCPVRASEAWLKASGCQYGPVFRKVDM